MCTGDWARPATSAPGLGSPLPHLHRDRAPLPHLHRDWARPCHICTGTGLAPARYDLTPWEILEITKVRAASIKQTAKIFGIPSERSLTTATLHA